ncbi:glucose-1-phosphate thymidylyltransferase, partial [Campylobacter jejuni]|nr:glucose-1-phosphate thymidylyltransferase [Campylobacter jejuni]
YKIACLEEIAYNNNWIDNEILEKRALLLSKSNYGQYLYKILSQGK